MRARGRGVWFPTVVMSQKKRTLLALAVACSLSACGATSPAAAPSAGVPVPLGEPWHVSFVPPMQAGSVGWCAVFVSSAGSSSGCEVRPTSAQPILWEDFSGQGPPPVAQGDVIAASSVKAISIAGSERIKTVPQPGLLPGLRAAAVELKRPRVREAMAALRTGFIALDAAGNRLPSAYRLPTEADEPTQAWRGASPPASGVCALQARGLPGLTPTSGRVVTTLRPYPGILGGGFLTCVGREFRFEHWPVTAALLLDAARPGSGEPAEIPGLRRLVGQGAVFIGRGANADYVAARRPRAWLVVEGGASVTQRLEVLTHLVGTTRASSAAR
jgi:hypothetical protein